MFATLTSRGPLTLPKAIRDRLNLDAGAILDFQIQADNTITARHVQPDARRIRGLLKSPHAAPPTAETMDEAALLTAHGGMPGSLLVRDVVWVEAVWTLKSAFHQDKPARSIAVQRLLEQTTFAFEDREAVAAALDFHEARSCGSVDCRVVANHARPGCEFTATLAPARPGPCRAARHCSGVPTASSE